MQSLSERIQDICAYANQAHNEFQADKSGSHKYTQAFSELLRSQIFNIDPKKQETIDEIVRTVFIAYDNMTEGPEKLALYIEHLITQLQADPNYLQHWSIQSVIDAFVDPQDLRFSGSYSPLEEYVNNIGNEIDENIKLYNQKSAARREDQIQDSGLLDDDDDAYQDLVRLLNEDPQALNSDPISNKADFSSENTRVMNHDQASLSSETSSEDVSLSSENEVTAEFLAEFSKKFNAIIKNFQAKFVTQPFLDTDKKTLSTTGKHVISALTESYKICFDQTVSTKTLTEFDSLVQSITNHWFYANDTNLSEKSSTLATQAFAKLGLSLMRLTEEARQDERLNPPSSSLHIG